MKFFSKVPQFQISHLLEKKTKMIPQENAETQNNNKFLIIAIFSDCFPLSIWNCISISICIFTKKAETLDICQTASCNHLAFSFPPGTLAKQPDAARPQDRLERPELGAVDQT